MIYSSCHVFVAQILLLRFSAYLRRVRTKYYDSAAAFNSAEVAARSKIKLCRIFFRLKKFLLPKRDTSGSSDYTKRSLQQQEEYLLGEEAGFGGLAPPPGSTSSSARSSMMDKKHRRHSTAATISSSSSGNMSSSFRVPNQHIISASDIHIQKELGAGEFGVVQQGVWTDEDSMRHQVR